MTTRRTAGRRRRRRRRGRRGRRRARRATAAHDRHRRCELLVGERVDRRRSSAARDGSAATTGSSVGGDVHDDGDLNAERGPRRTCAGACSPIGRAAASASCIHVPGARIPAAISWVSRPSSRSCVEDPLHQRDLAPLVRAERGLEPGLDLGGTAGSSGRPRCSIELRRRTSPTPRRSRGSCPSIGHMVSSMYMVELVLDAVGRHAREVEVLHGRPRQREQQLAVARHGGGSSTLAHPVLEVAVLDPPRQAPPTRRRRGPR